MSEEVELAAKATGEVVAALAEESGALSIPKEYARYVAARIHHRLYPRLVASAIDAAEKIRASGLPQRAFGELDEPLLTAILEGMAEEADPDLQKCWQNLLANMLVSQWGVKRTFPNLLRGLEPPEIAALDRLANRTAGAPQWTHFRPMEQLGDGLQQLSIENLVALGILRPSPDQSRTEWEEREGGATTETMSVLEFTHMGLAFVKAC